jgi:hypothetical protein
MHIHTIEEDYEYRMRNIVTKFLNQYDELQDLSPEELQEKLWDKNYAVEFGRLVLEDMSDFSGDELFAGDID